MKNNITLMFTLVILLNLVIYSQIKQANFSKNNTDINFKIGIVDGSIENGICLRTKNGSLSKNESVSIIMSLDEFPQKVYSANIVRKLSKSCSRRNSETFDKNKGKNYYYLLKFTDKKTNEFEIIYGLAVIKSKKQIQLKNNFAVIDLDGDGNMNYFRKCANSEGTIFTVWSGKPLQSKRIWSSYYYVDYDTQANCKKADWR
jgi:hypothetical protein